MKRKSFGIAVLAGLLCARASGEFGRPRFLVWVHHTPTETTPPFSTCVSTDLRRFVMLEGYNSESGPGTAGHPRCSPRPRTAGHRA